jgi:hypothetical protein
MTQSSGYQGHPETNGDPDRLVDEATELLVVEPEPGWRVMIEHLGCDSLIEVGCRSHQDALALLNRIEAAFTSGERHVRPSDSHLIALDRLRQAWIDESRGNPVTSTAPGV